MAPEVVLHQRYSIKCDVYSFAMTWYELLHRRPPFAEFKAAQAAFHAVYTGKRPEITLAPELSFFTSLLSACWATDPDERPAATDITQRVLSGLVASGAGAAIPQIGAAIPPMVAMGAMPLPAVPVMQGAAMQPGMPPAGMQPPGMPPAGMQPPGMGLPPADFGGELPPQVLTMAAPLKMEPPAGFMDGSMRP